MQKIILILVCLLTLLLVFGCTQQNASIQSTNTLQIIVDANCSSMKSQIEKDTCIHLLAYAEDNVDICDFVSSEKKDNCIVGVAGKDNNSQLCSQVVALDVKNFCLALTLKDIKYCEGVFDCPQDASGCDVCYSVVMRKSLDPSVCDKMTGQNYRAECLAITKKDTNYCDIIADNYERDGCYAGYIEVYHDKTKCQYISDTDLMHRCNTLEVK
jgi:hypothetical protein